MKGQEPRATVVASVRYGYGTPGFEGCRDGFLDGYAGRLDRMRASGEPDYFAAFWLGWDYGTEARRLDLSRSRQAMEEVWRP